MRAFLARVERDRLDVGCLGAAPVPFEHPADVAERHVRIREVGLEIEGALGRGPRRFEGAARRLAVVFGA